MKILKIVLLILLFSCKNSVQNYVCPPCGLACDKLTYTAKGNCTNCSMDLIKESELKKEVLTLNQVNIEVGSGKFLIEGANAKRDKPITVFYHKPRNFNSYSRVLIVIPGAGRNADTYRDTWIDTANEKGILVLSPRYEEENYPFEEYHLCGLIRNLNLDQSLEFVKNSNMVKIDENHLSYDINSKQEEWIFEDFDRIFDLAIAATESSQTKYDIFGHSAGGQILHRYALFGNSSKVNRILAANSGFYTLPSFEFELPFGLKSTILENKNLQDIFKRKLVVLVGELDNRTETRGTLLRSATADLQGLHRLERAQYFYNQAKAISNSKQFEFKWKLAVVSNVGHDHRKMSKAAADLLYSDKD